MGVHRRPRPRDEQGVSMIIIALVIVAMLTMVAVVIDLSDARSVKRSNQSAADAAAIAAGYYLSGRGNAAVAVSDPAGACDAAVVSLRQNLGLPSTATAPCASIAAAIAGGCRSTTAATSYAVSNAAPYTISIRYPVADADITESRFAGGLGIDDGTSCDRMMVTVQRTSTRFFAGVMGTAPTLSPVAKAVVKSTPKVTDTRVPALLLLERTGCGILQTSGQGGIQVQAPGNGQPALIQADSAGSTAGGCGTSTSVSASNYVMFGTQLPTASQSSGTAVCAPMANVATGCVYPSIQGQGTAAVPAQISIYGLQPTVGGRGVYTAPSGVYPVPVAGTISSRLPVDFKYNRTTAPNGAAITALKLRATSAVSEPTPPGAVVISSCGNPGTQSSSVAIVVTCNLSVANNQPVVLDAPKVIFQNEVSVGNGGVLTVAPSSAGSTVIFKKQLQIAGTVNLNTASKVYVQGCTSSCDGTANSGYSLRVDGNGTLNVNSPASASCTAQPGPGAGGTYTRTTELVTLGGPFIVSGSVKMCQTTVLMGESNVPEQEVGITSVEGSTCSIYLPCPVRSTMRSTGHGYLQLTGGSGTTLDWTAPNQLATSPTAAQPLDDLALWTESNSDSKIGGLGTNVTTGVFFAPNASVFFTGQASQTQPQDAQYIARSFNAAGQGVLSLKPNPNNSVKVPSSGDIVLIR